jgi:hypothetical protein
VKVRMPPGFLVEDGNNIFRAPLIGNTRARTFRVTASRSRSHARGKQPSAKGTEDNSSRVNDVPPATC